METVEALVKMGAKLDTVDSNGCSMLARVSHIPILKRLLELGAPVGDKSNSPLRYVRTTEQFEVLYNAGASMEVNDKFSILHEFCSYINPNLPLVKKAVELGHNINAQDDDGFTPARYAPGEVLE